MPEIIIRPSIKSDLENIKKIQHHFQTTYVWQMERKAEAGQIYVNFREVRLPRSVRVEYPHQIENFNALWVQRSNLLVATEKDMVVGYIRLKEQSTPNLAWVTDLAVKREMRRKGIASALLLAGQEWAESKKLKRVIIETQSKNHPTINMVLKLGYEFCGYNDHYFENQDIALFFARYLK
ncbi:MAG: GNAT family N-acetyltransferase [Anaerolineaceae bacterium]|nr:GNAT family N-acetyltransferase [Anaerolineaceae bacterium]